ncbi:MAG TPA: flagellar biosynthetic protein FliO [Candidatus Rubrimentiphilum sp.]|nr:flagellar biosynthetic protein FliO [Candidatus Rubrimentiphilum sp.]
MGFALHYLFALGIVGLLLLGLNTAARMFARGREFSAGKKSVRILDSAPLTKQAALHVAGIEGRRYLVGTAGNCVALLAELPGTSGEDPV